MKRRAVSLGLVLGAIILYLAFWPVPIEPVSWRAPVWPGYTGVHAVNNMLADKPFMRKLNLRLSRFLAPAPIHYGHAIAFTEDGTVVADLQDPTRRVRPN